MYNALVIGCGNIGALYDLDSDQVLTHVKGYVQNKAFTISVFDTNKELESKIASRYNTETIKSLDEESLKRFDCISICSPTSTHSNLLLLAFTSKVPVVICEKPVSNDLEELAILKKSYSKSQSKVIVNYIRRFQPTYEDLKQYISKLKEKEVLTNVSIRYQRGFINNASHAFDTVQYITDSIIALDKVQMSNTIYDHFSNDPTLTIQAKWGDANFNVLGLSNVRYSHFEIDLYYEYHKIKILDAGKIIEVHSSEKNEAFLNPLTKVFDKNDCLTNYMIPVINNASDLLKGNQVTDNFLESVSLNQNMLKLIS